MTDSLFGSLVVFCPIDDIALGIDMKHHLEQLWQGERVITLAIAKNISKTLKHACSISRNQYVPIIAIFSDESETQEDCNIMEASINSFDDPGAPPVKLINVYGMDCDFAFRQAMMFAHRNQEFIKPSVVAPKEYDFTFDFLEDPNASKSTKSIIISIDQDDFEDEESCQAQIDQIIEKIIRISNTKDRSDG